MGSGVGNKKKVPPQPPKKTVTPVRPQTNVSPMPGASSSRPITSTNVSHMPQWQGAGLSSSRPVTGTLPTNQSGKMDFSFTPYERAQKTKRTDLSWRVGGRAPEPVSKQEQIRNWPAFKGIPKYLPTQQIGQVPQREVNMSEDWRTRFGLPQGVTFGTNQMQFENAPTPGNGGINQYYKVDPYEPTPSPVDHSPFAQLNPLNLPWNKQYAQGETPYGNIFYKQPLRDYLSTGTNPEPIRATNAGYPWDNTLKSEFQALPGFTFDPMQGPPVADRAYDAIEDVRLNSGAPSEAPLEVPEMPAYIGYGGDGNGGYGYGGYGGGGGGYGGGYDQYPKTWYQQLYNWRL